MRQSTFLQSCRSVMRRVTAKQHCITAFRYVNGHFRRLAAILVLLDKLRWPEGRIAFGVRLLQRIGQKSARELPRACIRLQHPVPHMREDDLPTSTQMLGSELSPVGRRCWIVGARQQQRRHIAFDRSRDHVWRRRHIPKLTLSPKSPDNWVDDPRHRFGNPRFNGNLPLRVSQARVFGAAHAQFEAFAAKVEVIPMWHFQ